MSAVPKACPTTRALTAPFLPEGAATHGPKVPAGRHTPRPCGFTSGANEPRFVRFCADHIRRWIRIGAHGARTTKRPAQTWPLPWPVIPHRGRRDREKPRKSPRPSREEPRLGSSARAPALRPDGPHHHPALLVSDESELNKINTAIECQFSCLILWPNVTIIVKSWH